MKHRVGALDARHVRVEHTIVGKEVVWVRDGPARVIAVHLAGGSVST
jgi:hypothetical protein